MNGTLTDVAGLSVGHWTDAAAATGCTVVLCEGDGAVAGVDVRGSAPGTRETDLLAPVNSWSACTPCCSPGAAPSGWTPPAA